MNAFFYFGTDDLYPPHLFRFLRNGGESVIGGPCHREELPPYPPEEFLLDFHAARQEIPCSGSWVVAQAHIRPSPAV